MSTDNENVNGAVATFTPMLLGLLLFILTAVVGWVGYQASSVPTMEATFKSEIKYLNKNLKDLTETAQKTNSALDSYTRHHAANLARITEAIVTHRIKLDDLGEHCDKNEKELRACKTETDTRLRLLRDELKTVQEHDNKMEEELLKLNANDKVH
jgi:septal ring factor EnvC (AmiA/AmiB activator)